MLHLDMFEALYATFVALVATNARAASPQVQLGNTTLTGTTYLNQDFFGGEPYLLVFINSWSRKTLLGIPYAVPPLGDLRLQRPILQTILNTTEFNATSFGFSCLQGSVSASLIEPTAYLPNKLTLGCYIAY